MKDAYSKAESLNDEQFKLLIGVKRSTFSTMLEVLQVAYQKEHRKGGRPRSLSLENQLLLTLRHLRYYPTQRLLAFDFEINLATVHNTIVWVEDLLIADGRFNLKALLVPSAPTSLAVDATESQIQRPKKTNEVIILVNRSDIL